MAVQPTAQRPGRIDDLSRWGQVAFASRIALRVLPALHSFSSDSAFYGVPAAKACCFAPMHVALVRGGAYRALASRAAEAVLAYAGELRGARLASQCLAVAARIAATDDAKDGSSLGSLLAAYHDVAGVFGVYEDFQSAADADLRELLGYALDRGAAVPAEFFARPLWDADGGIPRPWQSVISDWAEVLSTVDESGFYRLYLTLCTGSRTLTLDEVAALADAWPPASEPAPPGGAPISASSVAKEEEREPVQTGPARPALAMFADRPVEADQPDLLGFQDYADSLAVILDDLVATPFTMSINAPWGAGKTSLANMVARRLQELPVPRGKPPHIICRFNAWMHDDAPNLATALVSAVTREANKNRPRWRRIVEPLPAELLDAGARGWRRSSYVLVVVLLTALGFWQVGEHLKHVDERARYDAALNETVQHTTILTPDGQTATGRSETATRVRARVPAPTAPAALGPADEVLKWLQTRLVLLGTFLTAFAGLVTVAVKLLSSTSLLSFVQSPTKAAEAGAIQAAQTTVGRFIEQATAGGNRFVVFVDDIERCKPPGAIDVLDAVSQLLDHPNVVVVLLGDMAAVSAAAQVKYKDLAEIYVPTADLIALGPERRKEVFGRLYIQKIVQFQFDLPALPRSKMREYVTNLLKSEDAARERHGGTAA